MTMYANDYDSYFPRYNFNPSFSYSGTQSIWPRLGNGPRESWLSPSMASLGYLTNVALMKCPSRQGGSVGLQFWYRETDTGYGYSGSKAIRLGKYPDIPAIQNSRWLWADNALGNGIDNRPPHDGRGLHAFFFDGHSRFIKKVSGIPMVDTLLNSRKYGFE